MEVGLELLLAECGIEASMHLGELADALGGEGHILLEEEDIRHILGATISAGDAIDDALPYLWILQPGDDMQQSGLTGTIFAGDEIDTRRDRRRDAAQRPGSRLSIRKL